MIAKDKQNKQRCRFIKAEPQDERTRVSWGGVFLAYSDLILMPCRHVKHLSLVTACLTSHKSRVITHRGLLRQMLCGRDLEWCVEMAWELVLCWRYPSKISTQSKTTVSSPRHLLRLIIEFRFRGRWRRIEFKKVSGLAIMHKMPSASIPAWLKINFSKLFSFELPFFVVIKSTGLWVMTVRVEVHLTLSLASIFAWRNTAYTH